MDCGSSDQTHSITFRSYVHGPLQVEGEGFGKVLAITLPKSWVVPGRDP